MARPCTICTHQEREAIDTALLNSEPYRNIMERYAVSLGALNRHNENHIAEALTKAAEASAVAHAGNLIDQVNQLQRSTLRILKKAEESDQFRTALMAIREARGNLELLAKLMGELNEGAVVNVLVNPEWHHVRTVIVESLAPFPDARVAVAHALEELESAP